MEDGNHENGNGKQPMKPPAENNNGGPRQPPPSQPPQQCPRCNSFNTKFCYYNNYSLSQPRYFCKNCRRYWTQGGTLRNVPVGGGCRKGAKRLVKGSTSGTLPSCSFVGESSRSQEHLLPPPPPLPALAPPHMRGFSSMSSLPFANSLYSAAGGILPSFGAMQNQNRPLINGIGSIGGGGSSSTNLSLLQGLIGSQNMHSRPPQVQQQQQLYQSSDPVHQMMAQPNRPLVSWTRGFINNPNSGSTNSTTTNVSWAQNMVLQPNITTSGSGLAGTPAMNNPNQWPDDDHLSGYDPPPPSS